MCLVSTELTRADQSGVLADEHRGRPVTRTASGRSSSGAPPGGRGVRVWWVVAALLCGVLVLPGCTPASPARGQTPEDAEEYLRTLPGIAAAAVSVEHSTSGLDVSNSNRALIILTLEPESTNETITDAEIDAIIQTAWSLHASRELANGVGVGMRGAPDVSVGKLLQRSGWVEEGAAVPGRTSTIIPARHLRERLGELPAAAPRATQCRVSSCGS